MRRRKSEILDVFWLLNAFLGFNRNNSHSLPTFRQKFCKPTFDSGVVICTLCLISGFPPFVVVEISIALDLLMQQVWNV